MVLPSPRTAAFAAAFAAAALAAPQPTAALAAPLATAALAAPLATAALAAAALATAVAAAAQPASRAAAQRVVHCVPQLPQRLLEGANVCRRHRRAHAAKVEQLGLSVLELARGLLVRRVGLGQ